MKELSFRQVHLDFHTSEKIKNIGGKFSKEQFQSMLKKGHVNSVNIFAKCHHGWGYNECVANEKHPELGFDLLKEMIDACHEIGVKCPIYISAGLDEKITRHHTDWLWRNKDESTSWSSDFMSAGYHLLCMNSPYLDYLVEQTKEIAKKYDCDGFWFDIVGERTCYCQNCVTIAEKRGLDWTSEDVMDELGKETFKRYVDTINNTVHSIIPDAMIFHNNGHVSKGRQDLIDVSSHLELESLPTGGWGYDHFPLSARYVQNSGKEFLGMTGKFHATWGEFGGFKHPNALRYEVSLCLAMGAKCSIGDQMHTLSMLEETTYTIIGKAFSEVEKKEKWCVGTSNKAQIAYISAEAEIAIGNLSKGITIDTAKNSDIGALRILQEGQYLFDIVDSTMELRQYDIVILPDEIKLTKAFQQKLCEYNKHGGKIIATGNSSLLLDEDKFGINFGIEYKKESEYQPSYCSTEFNLKDLNKTAFVMYSKANEIEVTSKDIEILAYNEKSYFNRSVFHFSSHQHTPNDCENKSVGIVKNKNGVYVPWRMFSDYATVGEITSKQIIIHIIDLLLGDKKLLTTTLPVPTLLTLRSQKLTNCDILHILYASPIKRGNVEVIEDIPDIYNSDIILTVSKPVKKLYKAPTMDEIAFEKNTNKISFTIDKFNCHEMVVIEY